MSFEEPLSEFSSLSDVILHNLRGKTIMMNATNKNQLLSRQEAAKFLGVKVITLAVWQSTKRHSLPVVKVGRLAKYRYGDLLDFIERQTVNKSANNN